MLRFMARRVRVSVREAAAAVGLRSSQTAYHHLTKLSGGAKAVASCSGMTKRLR
ncbi:MAG: hypothetical protein ACJ73Z_03515 [Rubrobacteraceae bacterium]